MKNPLNALSCLIVLALTLSVSNPNPSKYSDSTCLDNLDVPTRITPDGDNIDEVFSIHFPCKPEFFEIHMSDRFAEEVFASNDNAFIWNGSDKKGIPCVSGIYDWKIKYMFEMSFVEVSGQVLLLR